MNRLKYIRAVHILNCFGVIVSVHTNGDRIFIDLYVIIKYGLSIEAVAQSLKKAVKYRVEHFSGMVVDTINVHVVGIKV